MLITSLSPLLTNLGGYVDGRWFPGNESRSFSVINPATGEHLADLPSMGGPETTRAVEAAARALPTVPGVEHRREWLEQIARLLLDAKPELARIITLEQGKPLRESAAEVEYAAGFFSYFARHIHRLEPEVAAEDVKGCRWTVRHRPAGVVGLITPWNFPLGMLAKKLAAAIATGCTAVVKPASQTPLTTVALWGILETLGLPEGMLNLVVGPAGAIADVLCSHPLVRLISFTGSTEVGRQLIARTAPHVKRLSLELGGNAPFIVFEDANIAAAADGLMASKFRASGQTCVCANRVFVHERTAPEFVDAIVERVERLKVGDGMDPETDVGPLINREGFDKVSQHVQEAIRSGATRLVGTDPPRPEHDWGCFYPPTVLIGVRPEMRVAREETFGPVVAIARFTDGHDVVRLANATEFGLASYVFTRDAARADRVAAELHFGYVGLNTGTGPTPEAPFGGMKHSGFGREGGMDGLYEFTETQTVAVGRS
jgi:succinate-semialdehyde dehydrogenase / glutarate-semialdehyde dehydrogenase